MGNKPKPAYKMSKIDLFTFMFWFGCFDLNLCVLAHETEPISLEWSYPPDLVLFEDRNIFTSKVKKVADFFSDTELKPTASSVENVLESLKILIKKSINQKWQA